MNLKLNFDKSERNFHDHSTSESQPVLGWKVCVVDLLAEIVRRQKQNPEGGKTRAVWYKRVILYFPTGAWWNLDLALVKKS